MADRDDLFAGVFADFLLGEIPYSRGDMLVAFAPAGFPQIAHKTPVPVTPQRALTVPDAFAAEFVAGFDDAAVGVQFERLFAAFAAGFVERVQNNARRFASSVKR